MGMNTKWAKESSELRAEIARVRVALKRQVAEEVDGICECCNVSQGMDLHEVFVPRRLVPLKFQAQIYVRGNCALVCRACHEGPAQSEAFKERFALRLKQLGYEPYQLKL